MSPVLSIKSAMNLSWKDHFKVRLGSLFAKVFPTKTKRLYRSPKSEPRGLREKAIMAFLKRHALLTRSESFFERLHMDFWIGKGGQEFSTNCDHRFHDLFLKKQAVDIKRLREIWDVRQHKHLAEFGCNSGLVLDYLTQNLNGIVSSTGIEINPEQVRTNQESNQFDPRIEFVCADGGQWLLEHGKTNSLFVSNGGVLEYFTRERLDEMIRFIATNLSPAMFLAIEPVAEDHAEENRSSVPFGEELSFSHNYRDLFESNGFEVVHQRAVLYEQWKMMATIAIV